MHGWPGSHFEFLDILSLYREKYSPENLPYHIIAVSLPGWTLSSGPPLTRDFGMEDIGRIMNKLMVGLGFGSGYVLQGGDIGSFTACIMSGTYDECKGESGPSLHVKEKIGSSCLTVRHLLACSRPL